MFGCPLCERNNIWVYNGNLCEECVKVQNLSRIYGIEKICEILSKVLVVDKFIAKDMTTTPTLEEIAIKTEEQRVLRSNKA